MDPKIDEAERLVGSSDVNVLFARLREMALNEERPFNGTVDEKGGLVWTPAKGKNVRSLTLGTLRKRLARRQSSPASGR